METEVENQKPKGKKKATRKRQPINLKAAPVCCDLYSVKNFDIHSQKLKDVVTLSVSDEEIEVVNTNTRRSTREECARVKSPSTPPDTDILMIESDEELNNSQQSRGSPSPPTPPPELEGVQQMPSQQLSQVIQNVGQAVHNYRIRRFQESPATPVILIDESPSPKKQRKAIVVKIRSKSGLHRTIVRMEENFENVFDELAENEGVHVNQVMLLRGEQIIKLTDTPASLNLQLAHILDCVIVEAKNNNSMVEHVDQEQMISIKIQGLAKSSCTTISIAKTSNFSKLLKQYSDFIGVSEKNINLSFDGDPVNITSTPNSLDMENDDVIDATVT
ncbi:NFATC2-interacting protein-like [Antedon mediterranea]|uniref:NFATC2-interacting protein-like n=1 Tax=Antedon mediterranea TaxID=105859 RepID=UPI003AF624B0